MKNLLLTVTLLLLALAPARSHAQNVVVGQSCSASGLNAIATNGTPVVCTQPVGGGALVWTAVAGGGIAANSPVPANQAQGPRFNVVNYGTGVFNDTQKIADGVTAGGGSKTVSSATAQFVAGDVGKKIVCAAPGNITPQMSIATILIRNSATLVTTDTTDNGAAVNLQCIWYTKDATSAFTTANTAARSSISTTNDPNVGPTIGTSPGSVYCPEGGYAISGRIFSQIGTGSTTGPNFIGAGKGKCNIYIIPGTVDPNDGFAVLIQFYNSIGGVMQGFSIDGLAFGSTFTHPVVQMYAMQQFRAEDFSVTNTAQGDGSQATVDFRNSTNGVISNVFVQGSNNKDNDYACGFNGTQSTHVRALTCSNHNQTALFMGNGLTNGFRGIGGGNGVLVEQSTIDECGSTTLDCIILQTGGLANFVGGWLGVGNANRAAVSIDGTSMGYFSNMNIGQFGSTTVNSIGIRLASGGIANVSMSDIRGNGAAGIAVTGPAGAIFNDIGGNRIVNCVSGVCSAVTAATYATLGFTGGIVPKATVTHTPNTCFAVTGNLLATAQNLCTFLNDQNYQLLNITAQSGGTTPAASACATPPVITFSDGTRTATMTMTTAKTQWNSGVDSVTNLNQVFASGTTLTISIGANTCATPPANVSVSYVLQSVLNP
jgi:hypothetical protein